MIEQTGSDQTSLFESGNVINRDVIFDPKDWEKGLQPAGNPDRFGGRWRLIQAGLFNVWRFGELPLEAPSGRLLLRGANGTGKTTALEALWPYLMDLERRRLGAGSARSTTLASLMREGTETKQRVGYVWLTLAAPDGHSAFEAGAVLSYGVRLTFSQSASEPTKPTPFYVPAKPLHDFLLHTPTRETLTPRQFVELIESHGGQVFENEEAYRGHMAAHLWRTGGNQLAELAARIRQVRNPNLLSDLSPKTAADALRESLPVVDEGVVAATADALGASETTRQAFERDRRAAEQLDRFAEVWAGHVRSILGQVAEAAQEMVGHLRQTVAEEADAEAAYNVALIDQQEALELLGETDKGLLAAAARLSALTNSEEYRNNKGALTELRQASYFADKRLTQAAEVIQSSATSVVQLGQDLLRHSDDLQEDLGDELQEVERVLASPVFPVQPLSLLSTPRSPVRVDGVTYDIGPELRVEAEPAALTQAAEALLRAADDHQKRAEKAGLLITAHVEVARKEQVSETARKGAEGAARQLDNAIAGRDAAQERAQREADQLRSALARFAEQNPEIAAAEGSAETIGIEELGELAEQEPGHLLETAQQWQGWVQRRGNEQAAAADQQASDAQDRSAEIMAESQQLLDEALRLESGKLLPLPRPDWAGTVDDEIAFGSSLEWHGDASADERARVELALAASGALAAALDDDGAVAGVWRIQAGEAPIPELALTSMVMVDHDHPQAIQAQMVLERIELVNTVRGTEAGRGGRLSIGRDGSFRSGLLYGEPARTQEDIPVASHIGARSRIEAARRQADELRRQSAELNRQKAELDASGVEWRRRARALRSAVQQYPALNGLNRAETARSLAAEFMLGVRSLADEADKSAREAESTAAAARNNWRRQALDLGLSPDLAQLQQERESDEHGAKVLRRTAHRLMRRFSHQLQRLMDSANHLTTAEVAFAEALRVQTQALDHAFTAHEKLRAAEDTLGIAVREIDAKVSEENTRQETLKRLHIDQVKRKSAADTAVGTTGATLATARTVLAAARPAAKQAEARVRSLVGQRGVAETLWPGVGTPDSELLAETVILSIGEAPKASRKLLLDTYEQVKAELAGIWTLDRDEEFDGLETYVVISGDSVYSPIGAAAAARATARRAEEALALAEQSALEEFVIGRLPAAIGETWTRLNDWRDEVNRKMRSASASSGVGVQMRMQVAASLGPDERVVYELACKKSAAARTQQENTSLKDALRRLIDDADQGALRDRVAAAVDVRQWVDLNYVITRPGTDKSAVWTSRTGLSGGERRLVVLAPMLASIAAHYDRLGPDVPRLAALDEVPAEVDEQGREGLARYIAELDLDLICTSYLWDGAPGAWDGLDAWDLESTGDQVFGFPMHLRGHRSIPGDEW